MMIRVKYNHSYPIHNRYHEWHNYDKTETIEVDNFDMKSIQDAINKLEDDIGNNSIISCMPVMEE